MRTRSVKPGRSPFQLGQSTRENLVFGLGMMVFLLVIAGEILVYRWGRGALADGQTIPVLDHTVYLQWSSIKVPVIVTVGAVALALLVVLPAVIRPASVAVAIAGGFLSAAAILSLPESTSYHHDLLLSIPSLAGLHWSLFVVPVAPAAVLIAVYDMRAVQRWVRQDGPLPIAILAWLLTRLGERRERQGRIDQAERNFRRAYEQVRRPLGENDPRTLGPLIALAWFVFDHGANHEALQLFRRGLALAEKSRHVEGSTMARLLDGLASATSRDGNSHGALRLYEDAVRVAEEANGAMGWQVAMPLRHLAWAMVPESRLYDAERLAERSLTIARRSYGRRSRELVPFVGTLAHIRETQGRLADAARLYEEALQLTGRSSRGRDTWRAIALVNLARVRAHQGKHHEADKLYQQALTLVAADRAERRQVVPEALEGLASLRRREGRFSEAEQFARRALAEEEDLRGGNTLGVVGSLLRLGDLCTKQDKPQEARSYLDRAIAIIESRSGATDSSLAVPLQLLGWLEKSQGNYEVAERITQRAIGITEAHHGPQSRELMPLLLLLGAIASERESNTDAIRCFERGLTLAEKAHGRNHPETAQFLSALAFERELTGDLEAAERLHRDEIAALQSSRDSTDSAVADAFERFADFLERHNRTDEAVDAKRQSMERVVRHAWENPVDAS